MRKKIAIFVLLASLCGCEFFSAKRPHVSTTIYKGNSLNSLKEIPSGYIGSTAGYQKFFECWRHEIDSNSMNVARQSIAEPSHVPSSSPAGALPKSYTDFLAAGGLSFMSRRRMEESSRIDSRFLKPGEVKDFREFAPADLKIWNVSDFNVTDAQYFDYGKSQDTVAFRGQYLPDSIVVGTESNGGFYLLNPAVRTKDEEWEAILLHPKLPGTIRFKSFAYLVVQLYLEDRVGFKNLSSDEGYLSNFIGDLSQTCAGNIVKAI